MLHSERFDGFIVDEADHSLLEHGSIVDCTNDIVRGFWDLMMKHTVLLSATVNGSFLDLLH